MPLINAQGSPGISSLIQVLLNEKELDQRKQDLKLREQEREFEIAEQQNLLQQLAQQYAQGDPFAQQFVTGTPSLSGALQDQTLSPEELQDPMVLTAVAGMAEARQTFEQRRSQQEALTRISRMEGGRELAERARLVFNLQAGGVDTSLIPDLLPPDAQAIVDLQEARARLRSTQDAREADTFATSWLQRQGIIPEGANLIPGASKTLLTVAESREGDVVDWMQEGIDFITGRVGESVSGSPFAVAPDGSISLATGKDAVTVEQALSEWKAIVESYAPEGARERIIEQLDSGMFARRLNRDRAVLMASDILRNAGDTPQALIDIREILAEDYTPTEITDILSRARARAQRPRR